MISPPARPSVAGETMVAEHNSETIGQTEDAAVLLHQMQLPTKEPRNQSSSSSTRTMTDFQALWRRKVLDDRLVREPRPHDSTARRRHAPPPSVLGVEAIQAHHAGRGSVHLQKRPTRHFHRSTSAAHHHGNDEEEDWMADMLAAGCTIMNTSMATATTNSTASDDDDDEAAAAAVAVAGTTTSTTSIMMLGIRPRPVTLFPVQPDLVSLPPQEDDDDPSSSSIPPVQQQQQERQRRRRQQQQQQERQERQEDRALEDMTAILQHITGLESSGATMPPRWPAGSETAAREDDDDDEEEEKDDDDDCTSSRGSRGSNVLSNNISCLHHSEDHDDHDDNDEDYDDDLSNASFLLDPSVHSDQSSITCWFDDEQHAGHGYDDDESLDDLSFLHGDDQEVVEVEEGIVSG
jgi:hypothetical protein